MRDHLLGERDVRVVECTRSAGLWAGYGRREALAAGTTAHEDQGAGQCDCDGEKGFVGGCACRVLQVRWTRYRGALCSANCTNADGQHCDWQRRPVPAGESPELDRAK